MAACCQRCGGTLDEVLASVTLARACAIRRAIAAMRSVSLTRQLGCSSAASARPHTAPSPPASLRSGWGCSRAAERAAAAPRDTCSQPGPACTFAPMACAASDESGVALDRIAAHALDSQRCTPCARDRAQRNGSTRPRRHRPRTWISPGDRLAAAARHDEAAPVLMRHADAEARQQVQRDGHIGFGVSSPCTSMTMSCAWLTRGSAAARH